MLCIRNYFIHAWHFQPHTHPPAPIHRAPIHDAPIHDAPIHDAPIHDAPIHDAPIHDAPIHDAPIHDAPIHDAPIHDAPIHDAPIHDTPIHDAPTPNAPTPIHSTPTPIVMTGQSRRTPGTNLYAIMPYTHQLSVYRIPARTPLRQDLLRSTSLRHISVTGLPPDSISVYVHLCPTHQSPDPAQNPVTTLIEPRSRFSQMTCHNLYSAPAPFPVMGYALS
ncbi:hypothetical protein BU17DRAFT_103907 [Hysterangium stoloniferum]|nr:hypothetical protein BU17DRAFT_103907 [Hysterangium stoloniferum]